MNDIVKPGIILLIITIVAAGLLGAVNIATADAIAEQEALAKELSMKEVLPDAKSFGDEQRNEDKNFNIIKSYSEGLDDSGKTVGYTFSVTTKGFSTGLNLMIGITEDGTISGVDVLSHEETPGLGANAATDWKNQFSGKSGKLAVSKSDSPSESEIQAITGATITSTAVTNAVNTASDFYNSKIKGNPSSVSNDGTSGATVNSSEPSNPPEPVNPPQPSNPPEPTRPMQPLNHHREPGHHYANRGGVK